MDKSISKMIFNKIYKIFELSLVKVYIIPFFVSCIIFVVYILYIPDQNDLKFDYMEVLNAIGILSTFYLFGMEKIDLVSMLKSMKKEIPKKNGKIYTEGVVLVETYYALMIVQVFLLGLQYILMIFRFECMLLLIMSVIYMLVAFIFSISCWHGFTFSNRD